MAAFGTAGSAAYRRRARQFSARSPCVHPKCVERLFLSELLRRSARYIQRVEDSQQKYIVVSPSIPPRFAGQKNGGMAHSPSPPLSDKFLFEVSGWSARTLHPALSFSAP